MNISYNWLKRYLPTELPAGEIARILTDIGLEVEGFEKIETVRGGLQGVVVAEVLTCTDHPDSDHLHLTTVDVGSGEPLFDVCHQTPEARLVELLGRDQRVLGELLATLELLLRVVEALLRQFDLDRAVAVSLGDPGARALDLEVEAAEDVAGLDEVPALDGDLLEDSFGRGPDLHHAEGPRNADEHVRVGADRARHDADGGRRAGLVGGELHLAAHVRRGDARPGRARPRPA